MPSHPAPTRWLAYARARIESDAEYDDMTEHLESCPDCMALFETLPPPPFTVFGRPVLATNDPPPETERRVEQLTAILQSGVKSGRPVVLAGHGDTEGALLFSLSVCLSRLRKAARLSSSVLGNVYYPGRVSAPPRPFDVHIPVLLEAPAYPALGDWTSGFAVFVGHRDDWTRLGVQPDWTCSAGDDRSRDRAAIVECVQQQSPIWAAEVLMRAAFAIDTPIEQLPPDQREQPGLVAELTRDGNWPLPWLSAAAGVWNAREALSDKRLISQKPPDVAPAFWERALRVY